MKKVTATLKAERAFEVPAPGRAWPSLWLALLGITAAFAVSLYDLAVFALGSELYSYILLIPVISAFVAWRKRKQAARGGASNPRFAAVLLAVGVVLVLTGAIAGSLGARLSTEDRLALTTTAFVLCLAGGCAWFLPPRSFRAVLFPVGLLLFMVPLPTAARFAIESFMQHGSASVAQVFFEAAGTSVFREGLNFQLPGIMLHVAPECSGIRSTLVLLIVSVLAGSFYLRSSPARALLVLAVVPLALVRNGFRIFVIGELCVRVGPQIIDSPIHHQGGPIFFGLSLIPLFVLLLVLQRRDSSPSARRTTFPRGCA